MNPAQKDEAATTAAKAQPGSIKLYPNPANDELVISISTGNIEQVAILNIAGQELIRQAYNTGQVSVAMKDLQPGLYMVKVNGEYVGKVVKE